MSVYFGYFSIPMPGILHRCRQCHAAYDSIGAAMACERRDKKNRRR